MVAALVTMLLAVELSVYADSPLTVRGVDGEIIKQPTLTETAIDRLWQGFSGSMGALFGLLTGKTQ